LDYFNFTAYIPIIVMLFIILYVQRENDTVTARQITQKRRSEDNGKMLELAKKFIDKECIIYTFNSNQLQGIVREVGASALLIENKGMLEAINLDYILRIREFPTNKKGKKKSVVVD